MTKEYAWHISRESFSLVEKSGNDWISPTESGKTMQINVVAIPPVFSGLVGWEAESLPEIPIQFHEAIVFKAISTGYLTPPNMQPDAAQFFSQEYERKVKKAKHYAKAHRVIGGIINSVDF